MKHKAVAHPPCSAWCQLAGIIEKRWGHKRGEDGGCFEAALAAVRKYGGVLEHPAKSHAWKAFNLNRPKRGAWVSAGDDIGWVTEVSQDAYGHRAIKDTWLYAVAPELPFLDASKPIPTATVGKARNHGGGDLPRLHQKEARHTPEAFREVLIGIARSVIVDE